MSAIARFLDGLLSAISNVSNEPATSFVEIETVDTDRLSLVASDGSLATVLKVNGSMRLMGETEFNDAVDRLTSLMNSFMKDTGHSLQIYWIRDPEGSLDIVRRALEPARKQAEQLQLDFADLIDEKEREISKWIAFEAVYFVCWTHPGVLSPVEQKSARNQQKNENKDFLGMDFTGAQSPRALLSALRNRHQAYSSSVHSELVDLGILTDSLDAHEALKAMRMSVDPQWTPRDWKAVIPGDPIPVRFPIRAEEVGAVWWPPIASQVWPRDAKTLENRFVQIGDRIHAPMYVETPPVRAEEFQRLITRTMGLDRSLPWTASFLMSGNGLRKQNLKSTVASIIAVMNSDNPYIRDAIRSLKEYSKQGAVVQFQVAFNTWAPVGQLELLRQRAARLGQAFIDWGGAEVREVTGDPVEGFTSTGMGLSYKSVATEAAPPLVDVIPMIPITRPASPWRSGAELFTSPDGKLMPYQPGSELQNTWISLFSGGPGSGKSMQMFKQHFATCLAPMPGVTKLPYISIIDIGPSSSGLASLLKNALPPSMQHYVNYYRLRNTEEFCFNPFDLQLGMNYPLPEERSFLVDLVTMIVTPAETGKAYEGTAELVGMIIDQMYRSLMDDERGSPHEYHDGIDQKIDSALSAINYKPQEKDSWYGIRDALYRAGRTHEATLAQRYAVPVLSDAASAARNPSVMDIYGKKLTSGSGSETLPEAISRMVQSACREYKVFTGPTRFDIGESRVTIFDLDEVAKGGGPAGEKQISVMYGATMYLLTRNFSLTNDNLRDMPEEYRAYHYPRVKAVSSELKTICCDEFHRTGQGFSKTLRERVKVFGREGRKWNIQVMLGSQRLDDFDTEIVGMATAIYIMERPDEGLIQDYTDRFGLTETEQEALRKGVKGPRAGGATFFARMKVKEGYYNQLLRNPAGPMELWAGSTTAEDKMIREVAYAVLGPSEGRMALALAYPSGSAKKEADARKEQMVLKGVSLTGGVQEDMFKMMADEVIEKYQKRKNDRLRTEIAEQEMRNLKDAIR